MRSRRPLSDRSELFDHRDVHCLGRRAFPPRVYLVDGVFEALDTRHETGETLTGRHRLRVPLVPLVRDDVPRVLQVVEHVVDPRPWDVTLGGQPLCGDGAEL